MPGAQRKRTMASIVRFLAIRQKCSSWLFLCDTHMTQLANIMGAWSKDFRLRHPGFYETAYMSACKSISDVGTLVQSWLSSPRMATRLG